MIIIHLLILKPNLLFPLFCWRSCLYPASDGDFRCPNMSRDESTPAIYAQYMIN